jgi:two-component system cell cycle response regulator
MSHTRPRVLIISQNVGNELLITTALHKPALFSVQSSPSYAQALEALAAQAQGFQAVLIDFTGDLPDALDFIDRLMRLYTFLPIVILCEKGNEEDLIALMKSGVKDCVIKTGDFEEKLPRALREAIEKHKFEMLKTQFQKQLEERANRDFLTGALNRHRFNELYEYEVSSARRYKRPLAVAMIDLNDFKQINDKYGHKIGDEALIALSDLLKAQLRTADLIGRFGGDEFVVVMPETEFSQAQITFKRIREALNKFNHTMQLPCQLHISVGLSGSDGGYDNLIERADEEMYRVKMSRKSLSSQ